MEGGDLGLNLRATLRVRNDDMIRARERVGLSQGDVAKALGIALPTYARLEALSYKGRDVRKLAERVAGFLALDVEQVLPRGAEGVEIDSTKTTVAFVPLSRLLTQTEERLQIAGPEELVAQEDLRSKVLAAIESFPPRVARILRARFGLDGQDPEPIARIAERERLTGSRVGQILAQAFREVRGSGVGRPGERRGRALREIYNEVRREDYPAR